MAVNPINVLYKPKPQLLINAFLAFFIMHDMQIGIGIHGFQRVIYADAKHDAWASVLIAGIMVHVVTFIIIKTLQLYESTDLYGVHHDVYGRLIGKVFNAIWIIYFLMVAEVVLLNYIEVVQAWIFPELPNWILALSMIILIIYGITGGIRVIIGICFFNVLFTFWLVGLLLFPLKFAEFNQLLPILEANPKALLKGAYNMTLTVMGFELFYILYPHFKEKDRVQKYAHLGILLTTFVYFGVMTISIIYFSSGQLNEDIWATLTLFKIVKITFIERFEYVSVAYWMIIVLPNLMFYIWAAIRGMERAFGKGEKKSLWIFSALIFSTSIFIKTRLEINQINKLFSQGAVYIVYCYPILLFFLALVKKKWTSAKEQKT